MTKPAKFPARATRLYSVEAKFPNPNADYTITVRAFSKTNAMWIAADRFANSIAGRMGQMATIGRIERVAA